MHTDDRLRMFRSLGLAIAALLLVGGAVLGSQAISGQSHRSDANEPPGASADQSGDVQNGDASDKEDASESPEASPDQNVIDGDVNNEDVNHEDASDAAGPSTSKTDSENESEAAEPSESPDGGDESNGD